MNNRRLTLLVAAFAAAGLTASAGGPALSNIVLTTDRTVDCTSHQTIAKGIWRDGMNDQQKSYAMWRFFISRNLHKEEAGGVEDSGNAAETLAKSGYALCGGWANRWANCMVDNGMTATMVGLSGHWIGGVQYWGDWHGYDIDMDDIYVKSNGIVANPGDVRRLKDADGKFVLREGAPVKSYPWYLGPDSIKGTASLYAQASIGAPVAKQEKRKWEYNLTLRPGQEIVWSWYGDPDVGFVCLSHLPDVRSKKSTKSLREYLEGSYDYYTEADGKPKWNWGNRRGGLPPNPLHSWNGVGGNGRLTMDLGADGFKNALAMASGSENVQVKDGKLTLADSAKPGFLTLDFKIPYAYGDAWLEKPLPAKGLTVELDGKKIYPDGAGVDDGARIRLFDLVRGHSGFVLKLSLDAGAAPLDQFKAIGAFHLVHTALPAVLKGKNQVSVRLADPTLLAANPLRVTYVYDQVSTDRKVMRIEKVLSFTATEARTQALDTGDQHWPLMREIRMTCGGPAPQAKAPTDERGELDWGAAPWEWVYCGVNFWNDFERGDRKGWQGRLTTTNTFGGSDFALDNSLMQADGTRQLKIIRFGAFLNRDTHFRCQVWVRNVSRLQLSTRNQDQDKNNYYKKEFTTLKDGAWQPLEVAMNELTNDQAAKVRDNWFLANLYIQVWPAEGKAEKDVEFMLDNTVCWDGQLKNDPLADPDAPQKALAVDPIWNAKPPQPAP